MILFGLLAASFVTFPDTKQIRIYRQSNIFLHLCTILTALPPRVSSCPGRVGEIKLTLSSLTVLVAIDNDSLRTETGIDINENSFKQFDIIYTNDLGFSISLLIETVKPTG